MHQLDGDGVKRGDLEERLRRIEAENARLHHQLRSLEVERDRLAATLDHLPVGVWLADQNGPGVLFGSPWQANNCRTRFSRVIDA
jgi:predicted nuclease with TOPRIM domain